MTGKSQQTVPWKHREWKSAKELAWKGKRRRSGHGWTKRKPTSYLARAIIGEKNGLYIIEWVPGPDDQGPPRTLEPKRNASRALVRDWEKCKRAQRKRHENDVSKDICRPQLGSYEGKLHDKCLNNSQCLQRPADRTLSADNYSKLPRRPLQRHTARKKRFEVGQADNQARAPGNTVPQAVGRDGSGMQTGLASEVGAAHGQGTTSVPPGEAIGKTLSPQVLDSSRKSTTGIKLPTKGASQNLCGRYHTTPRSRIVSSRRTLVSARGQLRLDLKEKGTGLFRRSQLVYPPSS